MRIKTQGNADSFFQRIKVGIKSHFPATSQSLRSIKFFFQCRKRFWKHQQRARKLLYGTGKIHVLTGPFKGLRYYNKTIWGAIVPKWLGSYEVQLRPVIDEILETKPQRIIDIGAAEGFYAVGLARQLDHCEVVAFDIDPITRFRQRQLAKLNNIENLRIRGFCSPEILDSLTGRGCVVICDIEGAEIDLIDPDKCPSLLQCKLLIECHRINTLTPESVATFLSRRFASTHSITCFRSPDPSFDTWRETIPALRSADDAEMARCLDEGRDVNQTWLWMKPNRNIQIARSQPCCVFQTPRRTQRIEPLWTSLPMGHR